MKKYEFTGETKNVYGVTLHRIRCITAFGHVSVGDIGGWIEKESNLSHNDNAWVSGDACVYDNAWVSGNACVYGDSRVSGNACVTGNACVSGNARVYGDSRVSDNAQVSGNAQVTRKVITISSSYHHVTITDTHITIGCQNHPKEFWKNATFETIKELDGEKSATTFMEFKPFLMKLAEV